VAGRTISWEKCATAQTAEAAAAQPAAASASGKLRIAQFTLHCALRHDVRGPAHT